MRAAALGTAPQSAPRNCPKEAGRGKVNTDVILVTGAVMV